MKKIRSYDEAMKIKPLIGSYGKLPILIRDDDTNFFTRSDMLETIHFKAWDKGFTKLSEFPSRTVANPHKPSPIQEGL